MPARRKKSNPAKSTKKKVKRAPGAAEKLGAAPKAVKEGESDLVKQEKVRRGKFAKLGDTVRKLIK